MEILPQLHFHFVLNDYESQLQKGDNIIFTAFGGGFSWGAIYS